MPEYYIRTPDREESRGPFDISKLSTLVEAGQINDNTLYYDDEKEEWVPIGTNEELKAAIFPVREKLSLKVSKPSDTTEDSDDDDDDDDSAHESIRVEDMLAAAEGKSEDTKHLKQKEQSFNKAASISAAGLGLMMILSAVFLLAPHTSIIQSALDQQALGSLINYPFLVFGIIDLILAIITFLSVTEFFPVLRARSMLTLGFGLYISWVLKDDMLIMLFAAGSLGIYIASITKRFSIMIIAMVMGIGGNGYLAYLSLEGRFSGFFDVISSL